MSGEVAVVIPAYNAARFLDATLESVEAQTAKPAETVVVDDGSTDDTAVIAQAHDGVRIIRQQNAGVAAARNRGARATTAEWIAFLDADDLWTPDKLATQLARAAATAAGAVFCDLATIDADGQDMSPHDVPPVSLEMEPLLLHHESIPQGTSSTLLVRRSVFESIGGYDESLATMADWDLLIRLRMATSFAHVPRRLTAYRRYPGTMSRSVPMLERESLMILDKVFSRAGLDPALRALEGRSRAWNDLVLSGSHFAAGRFIPAVRFGSRAVFRNPRLIGRIAAMPLRRLRGTRAT